MPTTSRVGWTSRFAAEFGHRFETRAFHRRGWLLGILWTSEAPRAELAVEEALMAVHRGAYIERHGQARTLGQMVAQEGFAAAAAGCTTPALDPDDLLYTRDVLTPLLEARRPADCLRGSVRRRSGQAAWVQTAWSQRPRRIGPPDPRRSRDQRAIADVSPQPPLPTAWNVPFHSIVGSRTSILMSKSDDGRSVAATRQKPGRRLNCCTAAGPTPGRVKPPAGTLIVLMIAPSPANVRR